MIRTSILPGERHSELNQDNSLLSLLPCTLIFITTFIIATFITIAQLLIIIIITVVITTIPVPSKTLPCLVLRSDVNGCFVQNSDLFFKSEVRTLIQDTGLITDAWDAFVLVQHKSMAQTRKI